MHFRFPGAPALLLSGLTAGCDASPHAPLAPEQAWTGATAASVGSALFESPLTGTTTDGGTFRGTMQLVGAGFDDAIGPYLVVDVRGAAPGSAAGAGPLESVALHFSQVKLEYADGVKSKPDCIELELQPPEVSDAETKVTLNFAAVQISPLNGAAALIMDLICATDHTYDLALQSAPQ